MELNDNQPVKVLPSSYFKSKPKNLRIPVPFTVKYGVKIVDLAILPL